MFKPTPAKPKPQSLMPTKKIGETPQGQASRGLNPLELPLPPCFVAETGPALKRRLRVYGLGRLSSSGFRVRSAKFGDQTLSCGGKGLNPKDSGHITPSTHKTSGDQSLDYGFRVGTMSSTF